MRHHRLPATVTVGLRHPPSLGRYQLSTVLSLVSLSVLIHHSYTLSLSEGGAFKIQTLSEDNLDEKVFIM